MSSTLDDITIDGDETSAFSAPGAADARRLLAKADATTIPLPTKGARAARMAATALLRRIRDGRLDVVDTDGAATCYGDPDAALGATIVVRDGRAWTALVTEGSIGLGRGFIEGWWHSDDPTTVVRVIINNIGTLDDLRARVAAVRNPLTDPLRRLFPRRGREGNRDDIASHYDIGNAFFSLFLDETLSYSSAVFPDATTPLADASRHKYDRLLDKLDVGPAHDLLEIGTGWGGLALRAAARGGPVTSTTISSEQLAEARRRVEQADLAERVTLLDHDWRDLDGRFDRIVSIEMIEAVDWRDYPAFFSTLERCLAPDGMIGMQAICVPDRRYEAAKHTEDFIRRFVFPGGMLPSIAVITRTLAKHTRLQLLDVEDLSAHYAETLRRWRTTFDTNLDEIALLDLDDRFCRLWRFYLAYCEAGFLERQCTVNQLVLVGPDWRPDGLALRPH